jgi:hypothetical protein
MTDWDQRLLCADGGCVGVIGDDGLCKVCHRAAPNWGEPRTRGLVTPPDEPEPEAAPAAAASEVTPEADVESYEWSRRKLCPDGTCVGIVGADNKCKLCGRSAA